MKREKEVKQTYDVKDQLKKWYVSNQDTYENFLEELHSNYLGFLPIISFISSIKPDYFDRIKAEIRGGSDINLDSLFPKEDRTNFMNAFKKISVPEQQIIPALLYWVYFDRSYEFLVQKLENLRLHPDANFFNKRFASSVIETIQKKSVEDGLRTKDDWVKNIHLMNKINNPAPIYAFDNEKQEWSFDEKLQEKIVEYLRIGHDRRRIALLMICLEEELNIKFIGSIPSFYDYLTNLMATSGTKLSSLRNVQEGYAEMNTSSLQSKAPKDLKDNREMIEKLKEELFN